MRNPRVLLAGAVAAVAIVVGIVVLASSGGGDSTAGAQRDTSPAAPVRVVRAELTLGQVTRQDTRKRELLVSLPGPQLNVAEIVRGTPVVMLRCFDRAGKVVISHPHDWPLVEEVGFAPHIHQPADARQLRSIRRCRLTAPGVEFAGAVKGRLPVAG